MLYDNALLARAYLHGWQVSGDALLRRTAEETLDWALREMRGPEGGFYSALDADSEGVEGKFYVWTLDELRAALGDDADAAIAWFGATERGNFEGANVARVARARAAGRAARADPRARCSPRARSACARASTTSAWPPWNALMIAALADAGAVLGREDYLDAARARRRASCSTHMRDARRPPAAHLQRRRRRGSTPTSRTTPSCSRRCSSLYEATFEERWFVEARALADTIVARFADPERGGFFSTADDHEALVARRKDLEDAPIPSGASSAALGLLRLAALTGEHAYEEHARSASSRCCTRSRARHPTAFGHLLQALDFLPRAAARGRARRRPRRRVAALAAVVRERAAPAPRARRPGRATTAPRWRSWRAATPVDGRAAAYVCERFACRAPVTEPDELRALLEASGAPSHSDGRVCGQPSV